LEIGHLFTVQPEQALVHELVREAGIVRPGSPAICSWDGDLSYGELNVLVEKLHGAKLGLGVSTRALQYSAYVFDLSLLDVFGVLRFGGCVCVVSEEDRMNLDQLVAAMETMRVHISVLTPTVTILIDPTKIPSLETLVLAGEAVQPALVETWSTRVRLFNGYGPAECTVLSTINGPMTDKDRSRNLGKPLAITVWVVNHEDHNSLVSIAAVGELLIEGPLLARGYLHGLDKTAAAFITDPAFITRHSFTTTLDGQQPQPRRMYRTGDLVRQSAVDGSIAYVRRRDGQVKIRGQRVKLGDTEYWTRRAFPQAQTVAADLRQNVTTFFTTRINHLDCAPQWSLRVGETTYQAGLSLPDGAQDPSDIANTSVSHAHHIEVAFGYREGAILAEVADRLLSCLCAAIELFSAGSWGPILLDSLLGEQGDGILGVAPRRNLAEEDSEELEGQRKGWDLIEAGYAAFRLQQKGREVNVNDVLTQALSAGDMAQASTAEA